MAFKKFKCPKCGKNYGIKAIFRRHVQNSHPSQLKELVESVSQTTDKKYKCSKCEKNFGLKSTLRRHFQKSHPSQLKELVESVSPVTDKKFKCPKCGKNYGIKSNFRRHVHKSHPSQLKELVESVSQATDKKYKCPKCGKNYGFKSNLRRHVQKSHPSQLEELVESVTPATDKKFKCPKCGKSYGFKSHFRQHVQKSHPSQLKELVESVSPASDKKFKCPECGKSYGIKSHFRRHVQKSHLSQLKELVESVSPATDKKFKCPECGKSYGIKSHFRRHVQKSHPSQLKELGLLVTKKTLKHNCGLCNTDFKSLKSLYSHKRIIHNKIYTSIKKCPLCEHSGSQNDLLLHFTNAHEIAIETEESTFSTWKEFENWKEAVEDINKTQFLNQYKYALADGGISIIYVCSRSGNYVSQSKGLRHLKTQGSKKINGNCPAGMRVTRKVDGNCLVHFIKTHVGHTNQIEHMNLPSCERNYLSSKIASGIPFNNILDEIRGSISHSDLKRKHLLNRKDLINIESCFNLQSKAVRHTVDAISVEAWVNHMKETNNCVCLYKPQNEESHYPEIIKDDFLLVIMNDAQTELLKKYGADYICVDGTHGLNAYGFELVTLLVIDNMQQGFPVAFFFSNRTDQPALELFFASICEKSGKIVPKVFMSDMVEGFFNAWDKVMGHPENWLYCLWHVDRAWRENLKKIENIDKKNQTYEIIRTLMKERDPEVFKIMIAEAVAQMLEDPETSAFAAYFEANYIKNVKSWAYCHRLNCGLNTNIHVESMLKTIKYMYLQGKNVKCLDKAIHALMTFVRDKLVNKLIILNKGKLTKKLINIRSRHKSSLLLSTELISEDENGWWTAASPTMKDIYVVKKNCEDCQCQLVCSDCNACLHKYSCSCVDSSNKWNMCKHIHLVSRYQSTKQVLEQNEDIDDEEGIVYMYIEEGHETTTIVEELSSRITNLCSSSLDETKERMIKECLETIRGLNTESECDAFKNNMASMNPILSALRRESQNFEEHNDGQPEQTVPSNKNIEKQRCVYSTKKTKESPPNSLCKPMHDECENIVASLFLEQHGIHSVPM